MHNPPFNSGEWGQQKSTILFINRQLSIYLASKSLDYTGAEKHKKVLS